MATFAQQEVILCHVLSMHNIAVSHIVLYRNASHFVFKFITCKRKKNIWPNFGFEYHAGSATVFCYFYLIDFGDLTRWSLYGKTTFRTALKICIVSLNWINFSILNIHDIYIILFPNTFILWWIIITLTQCFS